MSAFAIIGAGLLVAAPIAAAFSVSGAATVGAGTASVLTAGANNQALPNVTISFAGDAGNSVWSNGDTITFELWDATVGAELSNTVADPQRRAAFTAKPTVRSNVGGIPITVTLTNGPTSSVSDELTLTFGQNAAENTTTTTFTISGLAVDLGTRIPYGHQIQLKLVASNGTPFSGGTGTKFVTVGSLPSLSATSIPVPNGVPGTLGVSLGTITVKDLAGATFQSGDAITVSLAGAKWASVPVSGGKPTTSAVSGVGTGTVSMTATSTSAIGDVLRFTGAKIDYAVVLGPITATITDGAVSASVVVATSVQQFRIGGSDRYATGAALFDSAFTTETSIVLTSGTNYPDALSAAFLANQMGTGVLTTDPSTLSPSTKQELIAHGVDTVFVVGGTAAVSANAAAQIQAIHVANNPSRLTIQVIRIGGSDRFSTNALVDRYNGTTATTAIVATGETFADALAVGPAIYRTGYPLVLTASNSLSPSASSTLTTLGVSHVIILGGSVAVSSAVESAIKSKGIKVDYRIAGADRTATAGQVASWETTGLPAYGVYAALPGLGFGGVGVVDLARGDSFADSLVAGTVAGKQQTVLLLCSSPSTLGSGAVTFLQGRISSITGVQAIGLTSAVSPAVLAAAAASIS
jgi:putative cell wall-binding protein